MWRSIRVPALTLALLLSCSACWTVHAQGSLEDERVMLQAFHWDSCRCGDPEHPTYGPTRWYDIVRHRVSEIRDARFDLVWLPPPCDAGDCGEGYAPRRLFTLDNQYGSAEQQRRLLEKLLEAGIEPVADVVINHRVGARDWADFEDPPWDTGAICSDDEYFARPEIAGASPPPPRGAPEQSPPYDGPCERCGARDLDHTNAQVREGIVRYLLLLQSIGYRGWRYDMVRGYPAKWVALYNRATEPKFSVGEYDFSSDSHARGWVWHSASDAAAKGWKHLASSSSVFDYNTYWTLKANKGNYGALYPRNARGREGEPVTPGLLADETDGLPWKGRCVTFVGNHDQGYRTKDGKPDCDHLTDHFRNGWEIEQAYAYILTHPGVPTVFWKHYFEWGDDLRLKIKALINARKVAGVHASSALHPQDNARAKGVYAARVEGHRGDLYVWIGGNKAKWEPSDSGYANYRDYAHGNGWQVWLALPANPPWQRAPLAGPLPVPMPRDPAQIDVSADLIREP